MPRRNRSPITQRKFPGPKLCAAKRAFASRRLAEQAINHRFHEQDGDLDLSVYQCPECGKWHLTSNRR